MSETRLWVTGAGLVTPLGKTLPATWQPLVRGDRAITKLSLFDTTGQRTSLAAEVRDVEVDDARWSRTSVMALSAAREAMAEARVDPRASRVGLVVGVTTSGMFETEALLAELHANPQARDVLGAMLTHPLTSTGDRLVETLGPFARVRTICSACSSGAYAFIAAAGWLLDDVVDVVVAGGADGLCRLTFTGFNALNAIDPEPCRPFDRRRRGLTLGEGAGFIVLERASSARARGTGPIAELAGWASGADAHHITNPEPTGEVISRLLTRALARANIDAGSVDYVNAHGTGTLLNDPMEAAALARALGDEVERVPVSSSKAQIGHTLGAAGAIEGIIASLVVREQMLVPTAGLDDPDPACRLVHVPKVGRPARVRSALSNSFGFGGMNSVLVFTEPELAKPKGTSRARVVITGVATLTPSGLDAGAPDARAVASPGGYDLDAFIDPARARRLDRPARLGAVIVERALKDAGVALDATNVRGMTGVVLGSAFGNVDASAAFMHRLFEKGPRLASPAEFPNLVPSSPVGHVSIYLGLRGPVMATADLATSGESAIAHAVALVGMGEAARIVCGSVEEKSDIVERSLRALFARSRADAETPRTEGGAAIVVEGEDEARQRGARVLARVVAVHEWRDECLPEIAAPPRGARAEVVLPRANHGVDKLLASSGWADCPRLICSESVGEHDGLGAVAIAVAARRIASGNADQVLVVGLAKGRGYAMTLEAP